jgi:hypothetical protein
VWILTVVNAMDEKESSLPYAVATTTKQCVGDCPVAPISLRDMHELHLNKVRERFQRALASYDGSGHVRVDKTDLDTLYFEYIAKEFHSTGYTLERDYQFLRCTAPFPTVPGVPIRSNVDRFCDGCSNCLDRKRFLHYRLEKTDDDDTDDDDTDDEESHPGKQRNHSKPKPTPSSECSNCIELKLKRRNRFFRVVCGLFVFLLALMTVLFTVIIISLFVDFTVLDVMERCVSLRESPSFGYF